MDETEVFRYLGWALLVIAVGRACYLRGYNAALSFANRKADEIIERARNQPLPSGISGQGERDD